MSTCGGQALRRSRSLGVLPRYPPFGRGGHTAGVVRRWPPSQRRHSSDLCPVDSRLFESELPLGGKFEGGSPGSAECRIDKERVGGMTPKRPRVRILLAPQPTGTGSSLKETREF